MSIAMDHETRNKSELLLPLVSLRFSIAETLSSSLEVVDLTEEELTTLGFLGPSELLSPLHTRVSSRSLMIVRPLRRCSSRSREIGPG
jgi:hypothetical protein